MKKIFDKFKILGLAYLLPILSFAQTNSSSGFTCNTNFRNIGDIFVWATCLISNAMIPLIFALAVVIFFWGVVKFIKESDSKEKEKGRTFMIWGIVALFVMVSVWGLVNVLNMTFGVRNVIPQLPAVSN